MRVLNTPKAGPGKNPLMSLNYAINIFMVIILLVIINKKNSIKVWIVLN